MPARRMGFRACGQGAGACWSRLADWDSVPGQPPAGRGRRRSFGIDTMDEKPERPPAGQRDLGAALRRARVENAERADAVAELKEIEFGRLALLESALQPVVRQAPPGVDLFDLTLAKGDRPRVFLDMVAFIEMARDRRTYRFFQDTLYGRVLIAESTKIDILVAACTNYVARRLVERERALACEIPRGDAGHEAEAALHAPLGGPVRAASAQAAAEPEASAPSGTRRSFWRRFADVLAFLLMAVGAATLVAALGLAVDLAWTHRLRSVLTHVLAWRLF